ncbi:MAG: fibronectin type III domain-containing protein [Halieaceae bacterium]|nr:fibronectin type III domain-containing protein [Halieaceae bacterium]
MAPSTPTITATDYEDGEITLRVSVADNGGTDITRYDASCTDGTNTYTGTSASSPITVSGLTNDVAYTCTVTATNSVGTSSASAATAPITPEEQVGGGLPIWLLYQATQ